MIRTAARSSPHGCSARNALTPQIALDICVREGAAAALEGAIASLGTSYVVGLPSIPCQDGAIFDQAQVQAERKSTCSTRWEARRLPCAASLENRSARSRAETQLEQATTPSLDALQNYTTGLAIMEQGHFRAAIPLFDRAVAIDPNFAMATTFWASRMNRPGIWNGARKMRNEPSASSIAYPRPSEPRSPLTITGLLASGQRDRCLSVGCPEQLSPKVGSPQPNKPHLHRHGAI